MTFNQALMARPEFHNPNLGDQLNRLDGVGSLLEHGTGLGGLLDGIFEGDVPNFGRMGEEQRADWERRQTPTAHHHHNQHHGSTQSRSIPFVPASSIKVAGTNSYAALLQERRNQQQQHNRK